MKTVSCRLKLRGRLVVSETHVVLESSFSRVVFVSVLVRLLWKVRMNREVSSSSLYLQASDIIFSIDSMDRAIFALCT